MCRNAPNQACEKLRVSTRLGLPVKQSKQDAQASLCAPRHKLTCRKKAVMSASASLLMPPVSASRTRTKRSRPAASPEKDGKGKVKRFLARRQPLSDYLGCAAATGTVISAETGPSQSAAGKAIEHKKQKTTVKEVAKKVAKEVAELASSSRRKQGGAVHAVVKQEASSNQPSPRKKQKTTAAPPGIPPMPEADKEYVHLPGMTQPAVKATHRLALNAQTGT